VRPVQSRESGIAVFHELQVVGVHDGLSFDFKPFP
jgi:hypothetical protein